MSDTVVEVEECLGTDVLAESEMPGKGKVHWCGELEEWDGSMASGMLV